MALGKRPVFSSRKLHTESTAFLANNEYVSFPVNSDKVPNSRTREVAEATVVSDLFEV